MDLAVNILVALVAIGGALGATYLNNCFQSSRESKAEKRKARDVYLQNVDSFIEETAELRAFLMNRDKDQIKELQASLPSLPPEYRIRIELVIKMASLAHTAFVALKAPDDARKQILQLSALIAKMNAEHGSSGKISIETHDAIIDGMAELRKAVLAVKNS